MYSSEFQMVRCHRVLHTAEVDPQLCPVSAAKGDPAKCPAAHVKHHHGESAPNSPRLGHAPLQLEIIDGGRITGHCKISN